MDSIPTLYGKQIEKARKILETKNSFLVINKSNDLSNRVIQKINVAEFLSYGIYTSNNSAPSNLASNFPELPKLGSLYFNKLSNKVDVYLLIEYQYSSQINQYQLGTIYHLNDEVIYNGIGYKALGDTKDYFDFEDWEIISPDSLTWIKILNSLTNELTGVTTINNLTITGSATVSNSSLGNAEANTQAATDNSNKIMTSKQFNSRFSVAGSVKLISSERYGSDEIPTVKVTIGNTTYRLLAANELTEIKAHSNCHSCHGSSSNNW